MCAFPYERVLETVGEAVENLGKKRGWKARGRIPIRPQSPNIG